MTAVDEIREVLASHAPVLLGEFDRIAAGQLDRPERCSCSKHSVCALHLGLLDPKAAA